MPRKAGQIVLWNIIAEIVQQEERIEVFCVSEAECTPEMHTRTFKSRFRFDKPLNRSDRHTGLQCRESLPFNAGLRGGLSLPPTSPLRIVHVFPYTGTAAPFMSFASSLHKNRMTRAMSSGFGHCVKSELGIALRFASVSMMLGSTELTRTPVPLRSAANESIIATAAAFDAA